MLGIEIFRDLSFYEHIFGTQTRVKFSKGSHTILYALDYIHSNLWGLLQSINANKYFLSLVDKFTMKV